MSLSLVFPIAPRHDTAHGHKIPDYGIFHIINAGTAKETGKLLASPLTSSGYGTTNSTRVADGERPRWTHGGDLFQDPLRYDSDDDTSLLSPRQFPDSYNSDASGSMAASYEQRRTNMGGGSAGGSSVAPV